MNGKLLRIAMLIQGYHPLIGGAENQLKSLVPFLQREGCQIDIITRRKNGLRPMEMIEQANVHRVFVPGPKSVASISYTCGGLIRLKKLKPDVIHAHELLSPTTTAVAAKRMFGVPVVAKVLGGGSLGDLAKLKARRMGKGRIHFYGKWVDKFIAVSREIDQELSLAGVAAEKRCYIPNGVDTSRFTAGNPFRKEEIRKRLDLSGNPIAIFTGRLAEEKRLDSMFQQWHFIRQKHPGALLLILGSGPEEQKLRAMMEPGIRLVGSVEDVTPYLQAADLFLLTSAREGMSNSMLEAMATGLAVVVTNVGAASDVIQSGQNGYLVARDDQLSFQKAVLELIDKPSLREDIGTNARNTIVRNYSLQAVAKQLRSLYESVC